MPETTVFKSGNSQAVRLPKEFRFSSKTVEIFRRGNEVVLREKPRTVGQMVDEAFADLPPLTEQDHADMGAVLAIIKEPQPQQERDWEALFGSAPKARRAPRKAKR
jgi:antitoxin VapB